MAYGSIKVDNIIFTNGGADQTTTVSGLYAAITSGVTVSGTISGNTIQGQTISGVTVTGTTIQGASGTFTSLTGVTTTGTTANFVSGVFTTSISGVTVTGTTASFTSGVFTSLSGTTTTVTSGIFGAGSATAPSVAVGTGTTYKPGIYSPGTDQLAISTNGTGRLFVDASGNVGVGASSSVSKFNVNVAASASLQRALYATNATDADFQVQLSTGYTLISTTTATPLAFGTSNTERMRLDSSGRLGLGTSTPGSLLEIKSAASSDCKHTVSVTTATQSAYTAFVNTTVSTVGTENSAGGNLVSGSSAYATVLSNNGAYPIQFGTNNTVRATLDSSGRLGIGATPSELLHVSGGLVRLEDGASGSVIRFYKSSAQTAFIANRSFGFHDGNGLALQTSTADPIRFAINDSEAVRIDSSKRLLVGTSSQSGGSLLQVNDNRIRIATAKTPASATDTGVAGEICWDANYIYVCTATNTWKRSAISTW